MTNSEAMWLVFVPYENPKEERGGSVAVREGAGLLDSSRQALQSSERPWRRSRVHGHRCLYDCSRLRHRESRTSLRMPPSARSVWPGRPPAPEIRSKPPRYTGASAEFSWQITRTDRIRRYADPSRSRKRHIRRGPHSRCPRPQRRPWCRHSPPDRSPERGCWPELRTQRCPRS